MCYTLKTAKTSSSGGDRQVKIIHYVKENHAPNVMQSWKKCLATVSGVRWDLTTEKKEKKKKAFITGSFPGLCHATSIYHAVRYIYTLCLCMRQVLWLLCPHSLPTWWTPVSSVRSSLCLSWPPILRNSSPEIFAFFSVCFREGFCYICLWLSGILHSAFKKHSLNE